MKRRIGIYPGTFDSVHRGHIAFSQEALQLCKLDEVIILPEKMPRGKYAVTDVALRHKMLTAALSPTPQLMALSLESAQFTVARTLPELQKLFPDVSLTLLIGSDVVCGSLAKWPNLATLITEVDLAIGMRHGQSVEQVTQELAKISEILKIDVHYTIVETQYAHLASSQLRGE